MAKHRKGNYMLEKLFRFAFNKALGACVASGVLATVAPLALDFLNLIQPVASMVPVLGRVVGIGTFILTWLTPKNKTA